MPSLLSTFRFWLVNSAPGHRCHIDLLEPRFLLAFANWSSIQPAIALVPTSAGQLASATVVNFGATVYSGPLNVSNTLNRIRADNGPDRTDDGIVYNSPQASGLPVDGTYFEFTVEVSGGTDHTFSGVASPGPMRILLATGGDCFFTGDHYSTFQPVSIYGSSSSSPVIGSFSPSPASVAIGSATTLTASNVTESGGSIASVMFYLESNGTAGLQTSGDTLLGSGVQSGTSWSISVPTTGLSSGVYTYYAVATDAASVSSAPSSTTLTITSGATSGVLAAWEVTGQSAYGTQGLSASTTAAGVTNSLGLTRGSGTSTTGGTAAANAWGASNWAADSSTGISANEFVTFGVTVGATTSLSALDLNYRHSSSGPNSGYWQYQLNGGSWGLIGDFPNQFSSNSSAGAAITEINLAGISALQSLPAGTTVDLRVTPYGATASGGTWYVYNRSGSDLVTYGSTSTSSPLTLTGPANYLRLDADGQNLDIWNNSTGPGSATPQRMLLSQISSMSYAGTVADDSLTVDFGGGDPLVAAVLNFTGAGGLNSLKVVGTTGADAIAVTSSQITVGSASINYSGVSNLVVDPGGGIDSLNVTSAVVSLPVAPVGAGIVTRNFSTITIGTNGALGVPTSPIHSDRTLIVTGSLSVTGTLDLGGNDLIIHNGTLTQIDTLLQNFDITSSAAAADSTHLTALAAIQNSIDGTPTGAALYGSFDTATAVMTDVLVKYTYVGDTNLDGKVDGSDYTRIDAGYLAKSTGWYNGDLNGDSIINGSDYTLIDNAFNTQRAVLSSRISPPAPASVSPDEIHKKHPGILSRDVLTAVVASILELDQH